MNAAMPTRPHSPAAGAQAVSAGSADLIDASHQRSLKYGIAAADEPDFSSPARHVLHEAIEENRFLFQHAAPVMETLYDQIVNTHSMVLLTSARGMVLHSLGDPDFLEKASRVALTPGMDWSERGKGTNAIGTALVVEAPTFVHAGEHYMHANGFLTCSAAPIFDPRGNMLCLLYF